MKNYEFFVFEGVVAYVLRQSGIPHTTTEEGAVVVRTGEAGWRVLLCSEEGAYVLTNGSGLHVIVPKERLVSVRLMD